MTATLVARAPSAVEHMAVIDGRLFVKTKSHGTFELIDGMLIPVLPAPTSQARH